MWAARNTRRLSNPNKHLTSLSENINSFWRLIATIHVNYTMIACIVFSLWSSVAEMVPKNLRVNDRPLSDPTSSFWIIYTNLVSPLNFFNHFATLLILQLCVISPINCSGLTYFKPRFSRHYWWLFTLVLDKATKKIKRDIGGWRRYK